MWNHTHKHITNKLTEQDTPCRLSWTQIASMGYLGYIHTLTPWHAQLFTSREEEEALIIIISGTFSTTIKRPPPPIAFIKMLCANSKVCTVELGHLATGDYSSSPLGLHAYWDALYLVVVSAQNNAGAPRGYTVISNRDCEHSVRSRIWDVVLFHSR